MSGDFSYCPICQLPLKAILIAPDLHVSQCMRRCEENNEECPDSVGCLSTDIFHYRDYSHKQLATYRASADFVPPDIEIKPILKRRTPRKSPKQREAVKSPRNTRSPLKTKLKDNDSGSDTEVLIPAKRVCRKLSLNKKCVPPTQTPLPSEKTVSSFVSKVKVKNNLVQEETTSNIASSEELGKSKKIVQTKGCNSESPDSESILNEHSILMPSSPEVGIPSTCIKTYLLDSSSSSDSELPMVVSDRNVIVNKTKDVCKVKNKAKNHEPKGVSEVGGALRPPSKTLVDFNGPPLVKRVSTEDLFSDIDSDPLVSLISNGNSSFVSSAETSTHCSDSAVLTDELTPSFRCSSTDTTCSGIRSGEAKTTYSSTTTDLSVISRVKPRNTAMKSTNVRNPVFSQSNSNSAVSSWSSDISKKEELLFGKKKKSPLKIKNKPSSAVPQPHNTDRDVAGDKPKWKALIHKMRENCFPSDLKIDSEDSLTVDSSGSDTSHAFTQHLPLRQCPFYKRIPDTPFAVDAFQYWNIAGVKVYFLSHFHSDHYIGLKKSFAQPIYCSKVTASLVHMKLRVDERWLRVLELNIPQVICGVEVTALDANHCPGSFMFLFSLRNGKNYLHVGDFRASKTMTFYPSLQRISVSKLFLDTTYCSPQYCFPTQEEVIGKVIDIVKNHVKNHPKTLVACGSYTIGKEKMFLGIAEALDWQVWARPEKQRVFGCLSEPRVSRRLVRDPRSANVHVLPMQSIQIMPLQHHLQSCCGTFTHVIGVKPTGWELDHRSQQFKVTTRDNITVYGVPYSEHSSFTELRDFVQFLQPQDIVPTVNVGSAASREKMNKHFSQWLQPGDNTNKTSNQTKVSQFFKQSGSS